MLLMLEWEDLVVDWMEVGVVGSVKNDLLMYFLDEGGAIY